MRYLAIAAFVAVNGPAMAQDAPANTRPTRDVAVTYRVTSPWEPTYDMRMAWSVTTGMQRVERPPGGREWTLLDQKAGSAATVMEAQRMIVTNPSSAVASMTQAIPADARFVRKGLAQVAGTDCREWEVTIPQGQSTVCLTEDGAMLRSVFGEGADLFRMEATSVEYSPSSSLFTLPQGYRETPARTAPPAQRQGR